MLLKIYCLKKKNNNPKFDEYITKIGWLFCICMSKLPMYFANVHSLKIIHNKKFRSQLLEKKNSFDYYSYSTLHLFQKFGCLCIHLLYIPSIGFNSLFITNEFNHGWTILINGWIKSNWMDVIHLVWIVSVYIQ